MKKSKTLEKMNIRDIIIRIGMPKKRDDIRATYKYDVNLGQVLHFEDEIMKNKLDKDNMLNIYEKYEELFDKDLFVFHVARILEKDYENIKKYNFLKVDYQPMILKFENKSMNLKDDLVDLEFVYKVLKESDVIDVWVSKKNNVHTIEYETSKHFIDDEEFIKKRENINIKVLELIDKDIGLDFVIKFLRPSDLIYICEYPNLGNILANFLYNNVNKFDNSITEYKDKVLNRTKKINQEIKDKIHVFNWKDFENVIRSYIKYIDTDKMLLLSVAVYYNKYGKDIEKFKLNEVNELEDYLNKIDKIIKKKNPIIFVPARFQTPISYELIKKLVVNLKENFIGDTYYSEQSVIKLGEDFLSGRRKINIISPNEFISHFDFKPREYLQILNSDKDAYTYIFDNKILDNYDLELIVSLQDEIYEKQLYTMIVNNLLTLEKLKRYYLSGKISYNTLIETEKMLNQFDIESDVSLIISNDDISDVYLNSYDKEKFNIIKKLYLHGLNAKSVEEKEKEGAAFFKTNNKLKDKKHLVRLYSMGLITYNNLKENLNIIEFEEIFVNGFLKVNDNKKYYLEFINDLKKLISILEKSDYKNKINFIKINYLIFSIFDNDRVAIKNIVNQLSDRNILKNKSIKENIKEFDNYCILNKLNTIYKIDSEYSIYVFENNYFLIYLQNKEKVIIDRYILNPDMVICNNSMYIIDEKFFRQNEKNIIENNSINEFAIKNMRNDRFLVDNKFVIRLYNDNGYKNLLKIFRINLNSSIYSNSDDEKINSLVKKIK